MAADESYAGETPTPETLESVWKEFSGELRQFIGRRVSRPQDADDILQLVALRMVQSSDELRDRRTVLGWLFAVIINQMHHQTLLIGLAHQRQEYSGATFAARNTRKLCRPLVGISRKFCCCHV